MAATNGRIEINDYQIISNFGNQSHVEGGRVPRLGQKNGNRPGIRKSEAGRPLSKCGCGKHKLQSSTKAGLVLQHVERSQREEDE
jgi:hypothetical protein